MALNLDKLENVKDRGGRIIAACPACRETGVDRNGEHLVILEGGHGKWGCVANPGPSGHEHRRRIAELAGLETTAIPRTLPPLRPRVACRPARPLPPLFTPTAQRLQQIAASRGWHTPEGLEVLAERGQLFTADVWDDGREWPAWLVGDSTRANVQARKFCRGLWTGIGGKKAKSLPGTTTTRMIGATCIGDRPEVWMMEGQPDFAAAPVVAKLIGRDLDQIAFVCVTGCNDNPAPLHPDDLAHFTGKVVTIAMHNDADHGKGAEAAHRWARQLYETGAADVTGFDFAASNAKDLDEYLVGLGKPLDLPPDTRARVSVPVAITRPESISPVAAKECTSARAFLVPMESPWVDGARYRFAHCYDLHRLPLFVRDDNGDTLRKHGVLILNPCLA